jgi:hypothetical protein
MASLSGFTLILGSFTIAAFGAFAWYTVRMHTVKPTDLAWRGIIKMVSLNGVPKSMAEIYPRWFFLLIAFFILGSVLAGCMAWATDHSFFVVIFPLLFYYFFARFFFWEKADLVD